MDEREDDVDVYERTKKKNKESSKDKDANFYERKNKSKKDLHEGKMKER